MPYYDLNVPWPVNIPSSSTANSKKGKEKANQNQQITTETGLQLLAETARQDLRSTVEMLLHCKLV